MKKGSYKQSLKGSPYKILSSKIVYENPWIKVREDKVLRPGEKKGIFGVIDYGQGVSIVVLNKKRGIYLVKEYYYAIEQYALQVPSGAIDQRETALEAGKRELLEETGLVSDKWIDLGMIHPFTMIMKSPAYLFLALDAKEKGQKEKEIEIIKIPFDKAYEMVMNNQIVHSGSVVAILKTKIWLDKNG